MFIGSLAFPEFFSNDFTGFIWLILNKPGLVLIVIFMIFIFLYFYFLEPFIFSEVSIKFSLNVSQDF